MLLYVSLGGFNPKYPRKIYNTPPFLWCIFKREELVLGGYTLDSRDKHKAYIDISRVENLVFVFEFVFSAVSASPLSGTSRFSIRNRWFKIENINVEHQTLMSMIIIYNISKGWNALTGTFKTNTIMTDDTEPNMFPGRNFWLPITYCISTRWLDPTTPPGAPNGIDTPPPMWGVLHYCIK